MTRSIIVLVISVFSFGFLSAQVSLSGQFKTATNQSFGNLDINILNSNGGLISTQHVDCDGLYNITGLEEGVEYTLEFSKESIPLNGLSTFDLVLTDRYILGIQSFNIYQQFAADLDGSGSASVLDLVYQRMLILAITTEFPNNLNKWLFFEEGAQQAEDSFTIQISADTSDYNFIGIARGDVNSSAVICQ